jgi:hypothetical protein
MPLRRIRHDSRHPFEVAFVLWMLVYSIVQLVFDQFPGAITTSSSGLFKWFWGGMLLVGAVLSVAGIVLDLLREWLMKRHPEREVTWRNDSTGLTLESGGMYFCSGALLLYGTTILAAMNSSSWFAGGTFVVFGGACLARAVVIRRDLRHVARGGMKP